MTIPEVPQHQPGGHPPAGDASHQTSHLSQPDPFDPPNVSAPRRPSNVKVYVFGAVGLFLGVVLGVIGSVTVGNVVQAANAAAAAEAEANKPKPLPDAVNKCKLSGKSTYAKLGDDGRTLSLDGKGEDDYNGLAWSDIECVLTAVNVPDYIREEMDSTRALDGTQRESWDIFSASWSYHPNSGANIVLRLSGGS